MAPLLTRQATHKVEKAVFVDRYGRRRRVVIGLGLIAAVALIGWLGLMVVSIVAVAVAGAPVPLPPA
jgi:MFS family permease